MTAQAQTANRRQARRAGAPSVSTLQPFIFPASREAQELYVQLEQGEILHQERGLTVTPRARLSFDTYLNSFYEAYWVRHSSLERLELLIQGTGRAWCTIVRQAPALGRTALVQRALDLDPSEGAQVSVPLERPDEGAPGRLFVRLDADEAGLRLERMAWGSPDPPRREVSLGVGICTFNREAFVAPTLARVLQADAPVRRVCVVNQGAPFGSAAIRQLRDLEPLRLGVVEQANFGGAGGFARAVLELLKDRDITHLLFMDDDIEMEAAHLTTAAAFLGHAAGPMVVGGQMLDLFDRVHMCEAGARVTADNVVRPNHRRLDLREASSLDRVARPCPTHFNGWWFAAIPADAFRAFGLPLPVFIRGDDMEHGVRLMLGGVPTVSAPPVSVWHQPAYAAPGGWKYYYDLRNRLIFASVHPDHSALDGPTRLAKILLAMIVRYDYQHVEIIRRAVLDFLRGPGLLDAPERLHRDIVAALEALAPEPLGDASALPAATPGPVSRRRRQLRLAASLVRALAGCPASDPAGVECRVEPDAPHHRMKLGRSYVVAEPGGRYCVRLRYSWSRSWRSLVRTGPVLLGYAARRRAAAARWARAYPDLISSEGWERRLGLAGATPARERPPAPARRASRGM